MKNKSALVGSYALGHSWSGYGWNRGMLHRCFLCSLADLQAALVATGRSHRHEGLLEYPKCRQAMAHAGMLKLVVTATNEFSFHYTRGVGLLLLLIFNF